MVAAHRLLQGNQWLCSEFTPEGLQRFKEKFMTSPKHAKTTKPSDIDLSDDPGISRSRGIVSPPDDEVMQAENTVEGDTANDTTPQGGVDPRHRGRTNK